MCSSDLFLGLLAILFPPIAGRPLCYPFSASPAHAHHATETDSILSLVWIKSGICTADSLINILLCTLGYLPGLIHAWYIISLYPEPDSEYETLNQNPEAGNAQGERVTYYYVGHRASGEALRSQSTPGNQRAYGTLPAPTHERPQYEQNGGQGQTEEGVPPSYEQAIQGDNKVQR